MANARICLNYQRPDYIDTRVQGKRGPFAPVLMGLEYLIAINKWQLRQRDYPLLYQSGIYYKTIPPAVDWHDIPTMLSLGYADCKDLVAYRVAELQTKFNIDAKPIIKWKWIEYEMFDKNTRNYYTQPILLIHVMVKLPNGTVEDPSALLGMGGEYQ